MSIRSYFKPVSYVREDWNYYYKRRCSEFLMSKEGSNIRESDENTLSSLMSRSVPMLESTNGFWSLRTFDVHVVIYYSILL